MKEMQIGYALGGGGAKAFSELGALLALEEAGIHPSFISKTSMGATIGSLYAMGYSAKELIGLFLSTRLHELFVLTFRSLNAPVENFPEGHFIKRMALHKMIPNRIEQTIIPLSINVTHRKPTKSIVLTEGALDEAVMSSNAAWGIRPISIHDFSIIRRVHKAYGKELDFSNKRLWLSDGCYLTNVPFDALDVLRKKHTVANSPHFDIALDVVNTYKPGILAGLNRFNRIILRIDQSREKRFYLENRGFYIKLDGNISQTDFSMKHIDRAIEIGYRTMRDALPKLRKEIERHKKIWRLD